MKKIITFLLLFVTFISTSQQIMETVKIDSIHIINSEGEVIKTHKGELRVDIKETLHINFGINFKFYNSDELIYDATIWGKFEEVDDARLGKIKTTIGEFSDSLKYVEVIDFVGTPNMGFRWYDGTLMVIYFTKK